MSAAIRPVPELECDLIMKGGITSGIVYPGAIKVLSDHYRFRAIGGASAGAIAAACAAAAEFGRQTGGFEQIACLPSELAGSKQDRTLLERLFKPEESTLPLLNWLKAGLVGDAPEATEGKHWIRAAGRWIVAAATTYPLVGLAASAIAASIVLAFVNGASVNIVAQSAMALVGLALGAVIASLILLLWVLRHLFRELPSNQFGLVSGMGRGDGDDSALTPWLHGKLQSLAGLTAQDHPLTFGDLWGAHECEPHSRKLDLRLMTTAISHGRSHSFPLEEDTEFYFREDELLRLFPGAIVDHLKAFERAPSNSVDIAVEREISAGGFRRLPLMADLPVLLPVRMSLAFPILLSAVPLHARRTDAGGKSRMEQVWFLDGGIISNFPIHFFDALIPSRPTFGIDLNYAQHVSPNPSPDDFVHLPRDNSPVLPENLSFKNSKGLPSVRKFVSAVVQTMHGWSDNAQLQVPGFGDRVVTISLRAGEGGLNLRMSGQLIGEIAKRGTAAGWRLVNHYHPQGTRPSGVITDWANHRWVRYRTASRLMEQALQSLQSSEAQTKDTAASLDRLHLQHPSYPLDSTRVSAAREAYAEILKLADWFERRRLALADKLKITNGPNAEIFGHDYPKPRSQLRIRPRD